MDMLNLLSWFLGSKAGRITALVVLTTLSAFFILRAAFQKGVSSEKAKQVAESLNALRERIRSDDTITKLPPDARRHELARWVRDDKERL